ncbi:gas vesicle protein K [Streptomyces sp. NPDC050147]|uniref:gas vesicle protein K n=1 Tax=Streptomyces sp. NPDC050147 TaxID=3155513 RepID=UPI00342BF2A9
MTQPARRPPPVGERVLASLVLTVAELRRRLMERRAVRRFYAGDLTDQQEERVGTALMLLDERVTDLCEWHGLRREDLDPDLGPLGSLLPHG